MQKSSHAPSRSASITASRTLWTNHGATSPEQLGLFTEGDRKASQADRMLDRLLLGVLTLPEIQRMGIAQHGARIRELRLRGYKIDNHMERMADGTIRSWYVLVRDAERDPAVQP